MPPLAGHPAPSLGLLPSLPNKAFRSPQIPALLLTRKNPASILLPRSEIAPYPKVHRAAAMKGGTGRESRTPGRGAHRPASPSSGREAAPAQYGERLPTVRRRTQGVGYCRARSSQSGREPRDRNQLEQERESLDRTVLRILLWREISLGRVI